MKPRLVAYVALLLAVANGVCASISHDPAGYSYHQHTITRPYDDAHDLSHWDYHGSTIVSDKFIRLTPDRQSRKGSLWNRVPFEPPPLPGKETIDEYPPWEAMLEFRIHGSGKKLFGDGIAFWYTKERAVEGPVFGNQDNFHGLGIFFDTYSNVQQGHQQYVSVMIGDGTNIYDHAKDGGDSKLAGCALDFRGKDHSVFARIVYHESLLRVYLDNSDEDWEECFIVRAVHLQRGGYFGVTSATGDLADNHDVIALKVAEPTAMSAEEAESMKHRIANDIRDHVGQGAHRDPQYDPELHPEQSSVPAVILVVAILAIIGIAIAVLVLATKEQRRANTHFT